MTETLDLPPNRSKQETYEALLPQMKALLGNESNFIARCSNFTAAIKEAFNYFWVGFYFVDSPEELVLGPFQGPIACSRIRLGRGVCGTAWKENKILNISDVEKFPGHIACNSLSKSEIVIPISSNNQIIGVLDIDSTKLNNFDETDAHYLNILCNLL